MAKRPKRPRDPNVLAKLIVDLATGEATEPPMPVPTAATEARRRGGLRGGKARAKKLSAARRKAIAKRAARARWDR